MKRGEGLEACGQNGSVAVCRPCFRGWSRKRRPLSNARSQPVADQRLWTVEPDAFLGCPPTVAAAVAAGADPARRGAPDRRLRGARRAGARARTFRVRSILRPSAPVPGEMDAAHGGRPESARCSTKAAVVVVASGASAAGTQARVAPELQQGTKPGGSSSSRAKKWSSCLIV